MSHGDHRRADRWRRLVPGLVVAGASGGVALAVLAAIALKAGSLPIQEVLADPYIRSITAFTLKQAALSTLLSVLVGFVAARALARRQVFVGRRLLLLFASLSLVIPTTVAAAGVVTVWGRVGWIETLAGVVDLPGPGQYFYGLPGIIIAHTFLNAPLMARMFLAALDTVPEGHWRLAAQLGMGPWARFMIVEWPATRAVLPSAASLVFMLCFTSFALVLMLGGGPHSSTLEVAIYEAMRFDFDLGRAASLALWQLLICTAALLVMSRFPLNVGRGTAGAVQRLRPDGAAVSARISDGSVLILFSAFVALPLAAVVVDGLTGALLALPGDTDFRAALWATLSVAGSAGLLTTVAALALSEARRTLLAPTRLAGYKSSRLVARLLDFAASIYLVVPAIVLGTGAFLLLAAHTDMYVLAPALVLLANVLLSLPFAVRAIQTRLTSVADRYDRQCQALGLRGWHRFRWIEWPLVRRDIGFAAALSSALSVGDLGVIALFGSDRFQTLPWLLYQKSGRYQSDEAAAIALALLVLTVVIFVGVERVVGGHHARTS
ncbi:MAG: thiamine/thiamine pyrophosphate ABC transporter, permease protein [Chromatiales bacterium]|jgi:thiamine transport system permease protein|nr:thiamine/thiamine pyrophosphate ABC transporter, permease protein [Chromatiales bacterium]